MQIVHHIRLECLNPKTVVPCMIVGSPIVKSFVKSGGEPRYRAWVNQKEIGGAWFAGIQIDAPEPPVLMKALKIAKSIVPGPNRILVTLKPAEPLYSLVEEWQYVLINPKLEKNEGNGYETIEIASADPLAWVPPLPPASATVVMVSGCGFMGAGDVIVNPSTASEWETDWDEDEGPAEVPCRLVETGGRRRIRLED